MAMNEMSTLDQLMKKIIMERINEFITSGLLNNLIEKEVQKQLMNRHIASKGYVKSKMLGKTQVLVSMEKQIRKLFSKINGLEKSVNKIMKEKTTQEFFQNIGYDWTDEDER